MSNTYSRSPPKSIKLSFGVFKVIGELLNVVTLSNLKLVVILRLLTSLKGKENWCFKSLTTVFLMMSSLNIS